jgi:hypothetical protein
MAAMNRKRGPREPRSVAGDRFDWVPEKELVVGVPRRRAPASADLKAVGRPGRRIAAADGEARSA